MKKIWANKKKIMCLNRLNGKQDGKDHRETFRFVKWTMILNLQEKERKFYFFIFCWIEKKFLEIKNAYEKSVVGSGFKYPNFRFVYFCIINTATAVDAATFAIAE